MRACRSSIIHLLKGISQRRLLAPTEELIVEGINYLFDTLPLLQQLTPPASPMCQLIPPDNIEDTEYSAVTKKRPILHRQRDWDISHWKTKRQKISHRP